MEEARNNWNNRNITVDVLRGLAMLLVVLGHTLTGCIKESEHTFVFNLIWALQMPLFILISGYVTKYSKPISSFDNLTKYIIKRTISYLLPWAVWTFVVRGFIFGKTEYLNLKWILYHMDSGYWFLFTIWVISLIYGISDFISRKVSKKDSELVLTGLFTIFFALLSIIPLTVGLIGGLSFLGTKLTLYYLPFYYCGFLYGRFQEKIQSKQLIKEISVALSLVIFLFIISRVYLYDLEESISDIAIRIVASMTGCISVCGLIGAMQKNSTKKIWGGVSLYRRSFSGSLSDSLSNTDTSNSKYRESVNESGLGNGELLHNGGKLHFLDIDDEAKQDIDEGSIWRKKISTGILNFYGRNSLEVYLLHGLFLCPFRATPLPILQQVSGTVLALSNFGVTIASVTVIIILLKNNKLLQKILFGK